MHELLFARLYKDDVDWSSGIGYARSGIDSINVHEIGEGLVYERGGVTVTATAVKHTITTYAYRFELPGHGPCSPETRRSATRWCNAPKVRICLCRMPARSTYGSMAMTGRAGFATP